VTATLLTINRRAFASLRIHRNYRLYFLGQAISQSGTWIDKVAQAWLVLALTHSAFAVGLLAACQFVPFSVLGLMAGVIVDRLDTWRTVVVTQAIRMVLAATLARDRPSAAVSALAVGLGAAAVETIRPVRESPVATAAAGAAPLLCSSRIRLTTNTS